MKVICSGTNFFSAQVLIVGGGDGGVAREVAKHPAVEKVVQCEIDSEVRYIVITHYVHDLIFDRRGFHSMGNYVYISVDVSLYNIPFDFI